MTVLSGGFASADSYEPAEPEPPTAPTEQPYQETRVVDAALPSAADGYDFLFSATVWWKPVPEHANWSDGAFPALAVSSVVSRALEIVRREEPGRASFARYLLDGELGAPLPDRSGRVRALAADVTLTLAPADRDRLRKLNDLRKDEEIWEYERQHERNKRSYLGEDVLKSTGSAVVWWLARHEDDIEKAVDMIGPLARIAAAAKDQEVPEIFRHLLVPPADVRSGDPLWGTDDPGGGAFDREEEVGVTDRLLLLLTAVGLKPDMDEYTVFVHRVMRSLEAAGLDEAAEEIGRNLLPAPDGDEGAEGRPSGEGAETGPRPPRPPASEDPPFTDPDTLTPETEQRDTSERNRDRWEPGEDNAAPPYFWDTSHSTHRPAAPHAGAEYNEEKDEN
ncbi:hypothetical protein ACFVFH_07745 [Streptomyces sp. NPDC057697]|uniref:hypothetical protein n=1 Tax=Streptomyces sp. NPDC057697 TaxID=3346219 RepID=UPI0036BA4C76